MWRIRATDSAHDHRLPGTILYWSEDVGWTWKEYSDTYTEDDKAETLLPRGGVWEEVHE